MVGYTGFGDTWLDFSSRIGSAIGKGRHLDKVNLRDLLLNCLTKVSEDTFQVLVAYHSEGKYGMFKGRTGSMVDIENQEIIGWGDSALGRYLLSHVASYPRPFSVWQARLFLCNLVHQASVFDGSYIGNGTDIRTISYRKDLGKVGVGVDDKARSAGLQHEIDTLDTWINYLWWELSDGDRIPNMGQFLERIKQYRQWATGKDDLTLTSSKDPQSPTGDPSRQRPSPE